MIRSLFLRRLLPALALTLLTAAATSAQPRPLSDRLARVVPTLTPAQQADLDALDLPAAGERTGARMWTLAADIQGVLTPEQTADLLSTRGARTARDRSRRPQRRRGGRTQGSESAREARQALVEQARSGALDASTFASRMEALRAQHRSDRLAAATPEQRERLEAAMARREDARAAREAALGLTPDQTEALQAIRFERLRLTPGPLDLRPYLEADGRLDRQAAEARRAQREASAPERDALRERADAVLTDAQKATLAIHRALARGARRGDARRGRG